MSARSSAVWNCGNAPKYIRQRPGALGVVTYLHVVFHAAGIAFFGNRICGGGDLFRGWMELYFSALWQNAARYGRRRGWHFGSVWSADDFWRAVGELARGHFAQFCAIEKRARNSVPSFVRLAQHRSIGEKDSNPGPQRPAILFAEALR
jgi:hypothetical protein